MASAEWPQELKKKRKGKFRFEKKQEKKISNDILSADDAEYQALSSRLPWEFGACEVFLNLCDAPRRWKKRDPLRVAAGEQQGRLQGC